MNQYSTMYMKIIDTFSIPKSKWPLVPQKTIMFPKGNSEGLVQTETLKHMYVES